MKYLVISCLLLAGCETTQIRPEWPAQPAIGVCEPLELAEPNEQLSVLLSVVARNYGKYQECSARTEAWQQWYNTQQQIYQNAR